MENATKALLIAAAVLVAILIISLGVGVYNMASESMSNVNLNAQEVQAHNDKFLGYVGLKERGSAVNTMLKTVFTYNTTETNAAKKVEVKYGTINSTTGAVTHESTVLLSKTATAPAKDVDTGNIYAVAALYDSKSGLITKIIIQQQP